MRSQLIDVCRGVAALWVVCFHYNASDWFHQHLSPAVRLKAFGHLGVSMFFVVSGYCIAASAAGALARREGAGRFLARRLVRIFPPYWASIAFGIGCLYAVGLVSAVRYGQIPEVRHAALDCDWATWVRVLTLTQGFAPGDGYGAKFEAFSTVYWTLALEVQFYLLVAAALLCRRWAAVVLVGVTVAAVPFVFWPASWQVGPCLPYWPPFAFGMLVFWYTRPTTVAGPPRSVRQAVVAGLTAAGVWFLLTQHAEAYNRYYLELGFAAWFAAVLWLVLPLLDERRPAGRWAGVVGWVAWPVALLGTVSYSLYLTHTSLYRVAGQAARQVMHPNSLVHDICIIAGVCVLCVPFYYLCERPFIASRWRRAKPATGAEPIAAVQPSGRSVCG